MVATNVSEEPHERDRAARSMGTKLLTTVDSNLLDISN